VTRAGIAFFTGVLKAVDCTNKVEDLLSLPPYMPLTPLSKRRRMPDVISVEASSELVIILDVWMELGGNLRSGPDTDVLPQTLLATGNSSIDRRAAVREEFGDGWSKSYRALPIHSICSCSRRYLSPPKDFWTISRLLIPSAFLCSTFSYIRLVIKATSSVVGLSVRTGAVEPSGSSAYCAH
jgi:hypothetical protein